MENDLVRYSRAGDAFHYRWAARRCLQMIYPNSRLQSIVIEGSKEPELDGEYKIDVAEYSVSPSPDNIPEGIAYYQLKHTTVRNDTPFSLSDLKETIEGFAKRYSDYFGKKADPSHSLKITFSIVTNRPFAENFKQNILKIGKGETVESRFLDTIENYTNLKGADLQKFCSLLELVDGEGDYDAQRYELHVEISQLLAGSVDNPQVDSVIALVQKKVLPDSNGEIVREEVLKCFGVTSERELHPAPPEFENIENPIIREQHQVLLDRIINSTSPIIIHASGGVGKSVFVCQLADSLPNGSLGIVYDCFGGGKYRNRSQPRHRHRDGLVQVANELASRGLCEPLIAQSTALEDEILRKFLQRLKMTVESLRKANEQAILVILIDAADNAEMASEEFSQRCFVHELLRESLPDGCRFVALCRTERIHLLKPGDEILILELEPFSKKETFIHLKRYFPGAAEFDGLEFHRLTNNGNPRVQANALNSRHNTITGILNSLGPLGATVEQQIEAQLKAAISAVKKVVTAIYQEHIDAICLGLANLPPFIPLSVLAAAAGVDESTVKSFIADLGRALLLTDSSVQFRDEPTETWFRDKFSATKDQIAAYVKRLEPLASKYSYVAETLPSLLLQAEKYNELIELALSDKFLPGDNPITQRSVRVYRLKFAFKAALKQERYVDAVKLALRAGEEVTGDQRQLELLKNNVDLIAPLLGPQKVQELAFRGMLRSGWDGSENVYSAALLSSVKDFKGEARGYLRSAERWLHLYFEERKKKENHYQQNKLNDEDIVELTFAYFNLFGVSRTVEFIQSWRSKELFFRISQSFIRRLIDAGNFDAVNEIESLASQSPYLMIALTHELLEVGRFPSADSLDQCLSLLATRRNRIPDPDRYIDAPIVSALISFTEACAKKKLLKTKILRVLSHYFNIRAPQSVSDNFEVNDRTPYLRMIALRCVLLGDNEPNLEKLLPKELIKKGQTNKYENEQDIRQFKEIVGGLLPWYKVRAYILINNNSDLSEISKDADQQSKKALEQRWREFDLIPNEISQIWIEILNLSRGATPDKIEKFFIDYLKENKKVRLQDHLKAVRCAYRYDHLSGIKNQLERSAYDIIDSISDKPEEKAELYIDLCRAVFPVCLDDAGAYFDYAIEAVSKFGDEIVQRWGAVAALANRGAEEGPVNPQMAYRFIRCAELVGDFTYDEDYWNRNEAVRICARLSSNSALAALSRWRDRDVGWFASQLPSLADELVKSNKLSTSISWSLSAFFEGYGLEDFASLCIEKEQSHVRRQYILNKVIRDLRLNESEEKSWQKLKDTAQQYSIENSELDDIFTFYIENPRMDSEPTTNDLILDSVDMEEPEPIDWEKIFGGLELTTTTGINKAIKNFNALSGRYHDFKAFCEEVCKRVDENEVNKFLQSLVDAEYAGFYNIREFFSCMPRGWLCKVSVKRNWGTILQMISRRFALTLTQDNGLEHFLKDVPVEKNDMDFIRKGILEGLSGKSDFADAGIFFGFVDIVSSLISPQEAMDLLDFALSRFELYINDDDADGFWADWLKPPEEMSMAFTGFVWSALGSPRAETRWRAAHCVRRLAEGGCKDEIHALIQWLERDRVDAFGSHKFPFYNLHARQYLMIALARVSIDYPAMLIDYQAIFLKHALATESGILTQKFSAEIALNFENAFPDTYSQKDIQQLHQVGVSQLPIKELDYNSDKRKSSWHEKGEFDTNLKFRHEIGFDRYWFEPLGDVFGISNKQVIELATETIVKEWGINVDDLAKDPRKELRHSSRINKEINHSHGEYPMADTYRFYLSYHAMLIVAGRLLKKMPVVHRNEWCEDEWAEWFHRHTLTRTDGRWLSDRRDPVPLLKRSWNIQKENGNWPDKITENDFLKALLTERKNETWLNISGGWDENDDKCQDSIYISTALVAPEASQSLLNALTTCTNPTDFKLPDYQEKEMEIELSPFELKGWIWQKFNYKDNCLDKYDPYAGQIDFSPYEVGQPIVEKMGLSTDSEQREWLLTGSKNASLLCELWSTNRPGQNESSGMRGNRFSASLTFLKKLCEIMEYEIIFKVKIERQFNNNFNKKEEDETMYKSPDYKIYILSADGKLRDTGMHYQLR